MHLLSSYGREPLQELVDACTLVEVLEQRAYRQARAFEAPCAAERSGATGPKRATVGTFVAAGNR
jgi:hypothetical protein